MSGTKKCLEGWREILIIFGLPFNFMFLYRFNLEDLCIYSIGTIL